MQHLLLRRSFAGRNKLYIQRSPRCSMTPLLRRSRRYPPGMLTSSWLMLTALGRRDHMTTAPRTKPVTDMVIPGSVINSHQNGWRTLSHRCRSSWKAWAGIRGQVYAHRSSLLLRTIKLEGVATIIVVGTRGALSNSTTEREAHYCPPYHGGTNAEALSKTSRSTRGHLQEARKMHHSSNF